MFNSPVSLPRLSVDLIRAANRSEEFPKTAPSELSASVERYLKFLLLCADHPARPLAPTRDIDQIWHLHMLHPRAYHRDCEAIVGEVLDHDGGFGAGDEGPELVRIFEETASLWEAKFGEPYVDVPLAFIVKCTRNCVSRCTRKCKT